MKAIIVGGGIGGLTTALMLRARGIDCELFEQSDSIRELGVGINTLPQSAPMTCIISIATARRSGASRVASAPATMYRSSRFIADVCKASFIAPSRNGWARGRSTPVAGSAISRSTKAV